MTPNIININITFALYVSVNVRWRASTDDDVRSRISTDVGARWRAVTDVDVRPLADINAVDVHSVNGPLASYSHYDVIGATPSVTDVRTYGHLTAFNIYTSRDYLFVPSCRPCTALYLTNTVLTNRHTQNKLLPYRPNNCNMFLIH